MCLRHAERDSGGCDSVGSPVGGPECRSDYDNLQAQYQLLRHQHSDTIRRFVLFYLVFVLFFSWGKNDCPE